MQPTLLDEVGLNGLFIRAWTKRKCENGYCQQLAGRSCSLIYPIIFITQSCQQFGLPASESKKLAHRAKANSLVSFNDHLVAQIEFEVTIGAGPESWRVAHQLLGLA